MYGVHKCKYQYHSSSSSKTKKILVTIGAKRTISKSFRKCLSNLLAKQEIKELKKSYIGHCTHTSESTVVKLQNI